MKAIWVSLLLIMTFACGEKFDAALYLEELESQAAVYEEEVATTLAIKSLPGMLALGTTWDAQIGYVDDVPAFIRMTATTNKAHKMWWSLDTANGKLQMLDESNTLADGKSVRLLFAYKFDSLVLSKAGEGAYTPTGPNDFRTNFAKANETANQLLTLITADRTDLSAAANAARKRNAQFFASGKGWGLSLNPSIKQVLFTGADGVEQSFGYSLPATGANGESLYVVRNLKEKLNFSILSKPCSSANGAVYPYTVSVSYNGKTYTGCGSIIQ